MNVKLYNIFKFSDNLTVIKEIQSENTPPYRSITLSGISIFYIELQVLNASPYIEITLFGIFIDYNL